MKKGSRAMVMAAVLAANLMLFGCGRETVSKRPTLNTNFQPKESSFRFEAQPSENLRLSETGAAAVLAALENTHPDYFCAEYYDLRQVISRLEFDAAVESHQHSALNGAGVLEGAHLAALVKQNNESFMATKPFGYTPVEGDYINDLCDFIAEVVNTMAKNYPDVDWNRVYCNLGALKILYNGGMLSYAQVTDERILAISKNNTEIVLNMKGADGFTRVLTHEIMHLIQLGCPCEPVDKLGRRAGIAMYWDDFTLNTTDWTWLVEGSAERHMCRLTGGEAVSYQYKMDYICSLTMSILLRDDVQADTVENLCFYSDPAQLFDAFGCETAEQIEELLNMMITLQVLQMQPKSFHQMYAEKTGVDLMKDADAMDQFSYALKPAVCITLSKEFYENLTAFLQQQPVSCNDLFLLINLFEGHLNQHLKFTKEANAAVNKPFIDTYKNLRTALFTALETDNPGIDVTALYESYSITTDEKNILNGSLSMLPEEKRAFLAERAQWQDGLTGLGAKVG